VSVLDSSALVEVVRRGPHAEWVAGWIHDGCTLHLADSEGVAAITGLMRGGAISRERAAQATRLIDELAEALDEPVVTLDRRPARGAPSSIRILTPPDETAT